MAHSILRKLAYVAGFALIIIMVFLVAKETYRKNQIQKMIYDLNAQAERLDREKTEIADKISYLESPDFRKKEIKEKFNMQEPEENVVVIKPSISQTAPEEERKVLIQNRDPVIPNPLKWWNYFFKY